MRKKKTESKEFVNIWTVSSKSDKMSFLYIQRVKNLSNQISNSSTNFSFEIKQLEF